MQASDYLHQYLEGWRLGDGALSLSATVPKFYYDDPNTGRILREDLIGFVEDFKTGVAEMTGRRISKPFLTYTDVVISEQDAVCWCWWQATGSELQGAALIRFGPKGVISEKIGYFSKFP